MSQSASQRRLVLVTDPMCSWCWGMAEEFESARVALADTVEFELLLGGINTHGTQHIGDYGRRYLMKLWQEVAATTGAQFGFELPDEYVHNSVLPCLAVEAYSRLSGCPGFEYLHGIQKDFFVGGLNINNRAYLVKQAEQRGLDAEHFAARLDLPATLESVRFQFDHAGQFGTQAMPSLLLDDGAGLKLLAGGYVDAQMLASLLETAEAN